MSASRTGEKWSRVLVALLISIGFTISACSSSPNSAQGDILIGVNIELTGVHQERGLAIRRALELSLDAINERRILEDRKIRLLVRDNKSNPTEAVHVATDLVDAGVAAMIGAGASDTSLAIIDLVSSHGIPTISIGEDSAITQPIEKRQFLFATPTTTDVMIKEILTDIAAQNHQNILLVTGRDERSRASGSAFERFASEMRLSQENLAVRSVDASSDSLAQFVEQSTLSDEEYPDVIVICSPTPITVETVRKIREAEYAGPIYLGPYVDPNSFLSKAGLAGEGIRATHPSILGALNLASTNPSVIRQKEFYNDYTSAYGAFSSFAPYAADALELLATAIEAGGQATRDIIRDSLETISYDGLAGTYRFSRSHHSGTQGDSLMVFVIRQGGWTPTQASGSGVL